MIKKYNGDLLNSPANIIIHQCNCMNVMGAGIAKQIKDKYPEAYAIDLTTPKSIEKMGGFSWEYIERDGSGHFPMEQKIIINLYGQGRYGRDMRYTNYEALAVGLLQIKIFINNIRNKFENNNTPAYAKRIELINNSILSTNPVLGFPHKMGCENGGGDIRVVHALINSTFENEPYDVLLCKMFFSYM